MSVLKGLNQYGNTLNLFRKSFLDILKKQKVKFAITALLTTYTTKSGTIGFQTNPIRN